MSTVEARAPGPAALFAALGDPTRLQLVSTLSDGRPRSLSVLAADAPVTRQAVAKHLAVLEGAGWVRRARAGRESRYVLRPEPVTEARAWLREVEAQWAGALERLRLHVDG